MRTHLALIVATLVLLTGCKSGTKDGISCTQELKNGVIVDLSDAKTGAPINGATLILDNGKGYRESMQQVSNTPVATYMGATDVAGTFDLTISAAGYEPDSRNGIEVRWNGCELLIKKFEIRLAQSDSTQPLGGVVVLDYGFGEVEIREWTAR